MQRFFLLFLVAGFLCPLSLSAQRIRSVKGEYIYYPPETQSMEMARQVAVERTKLQILADNFGTVMQSASSLRVEQSSGKSAVNTSTLSVSEVRGEWLETTDGPEIETILSPDGMIGLRVKITGRAREITLARAEIQTQVLCNGTESRFASLEFKEGDDLFLRFKSPVDGYLVVYLHDGGDEVSCLLPYSNQHDLPSFPIQAMQDYLFFSGGDADELTLTCAGQQEINRLYVIFSPNRLSRAVDVAGRSAEMPRTLSWIAFQRYLSRVRAADQEMIVEEYMITIDKL